MRYLGAQHPCWDEVRGETGNKKLFDEGQPGKLADYSSVNGSGYGAEIVRRRRATYAQY